MDPLLVILIVLVVLYGMGNAMAVGPLIHVLLVVIVILLLVKVLNK